MIHQRYIYQVDIMNPWAAPYDLAFLDSGADNTVEVTAVARTGVDLQEKVFINEF